ncbi:putative toxin-antitoxin system toxin component, PIN family [Leptolyngbya sp. NK1-12]|uniref:Toxin-antitoxin system toxin component, PIN family n=1 Tax=Leptolyngbya sp. NK1-12 TaxID=2547451 RepID=A0AA96WDP4_9CYAN|nr:putative toxin-antitoxin system toxin component, PIN family [Leptolyngbya sp. NK1-12]WNZ23314.1 putative toxin-antitoxin system toxin component, PIN family [Leptolyngbya sp. NK1-12]
MRSRIVVDTSVLISALIGPQGPSRESVRCCLLEECQPLMGNTLFCEYEAVVSREEIISQCPLTSLEISDLLAAFMSVCEWVQIYYLWRPNLRDEQDNHLIELAIAGNARAIVTNNIRDFQDAELIFPNLSILQPEQLIRS